MSEPNLTKNDGNQDVPPPEDDPNAPPPGDDPPADGEGEAGDDPDHEAQATLARARGWTPPDQWKGKRPDNIIDDPAEFNRQHEQNNRRLREDNARLYGEMSELKKVTQQNFEMLRRSTDAENKRLRDALEARQRAAVEDADTRAHDEATRELRALDAAEAAPAAPPAAAPAAPAQPAHDVADDLHFRSWHEDNPWYGTDAGRTKYAENIAVKDVQARGLTAQHGRAYYDAIKAEVDAAFGAPARRSTPNNAGAQAGGQRKSAKSFDSLPGSVKDDFRKTLVKKLGIYKDDEKGRAEYSAAYYHEQKAAEGR